MPDPEFVTISEAARALGVDARQVRRWVDRLEPKDKGQDTQRTHKGQPIVTVRLSAVEALQNGDNRGESPKDTTKGQSRDTVQRPVRVSDGMSLEMAAKLADAEKRAAVAEAKAELLEKSIADVQAERNDWKEQAGKLDSRMAEALEALQRAQDETRAARLIGNREGGRAVQQIEGFEASGESPATQEDSKPRNWWPFTRKRQVK